jgi:hypothetical protein
VIEGNIRLNLPLAVEGPDAHFSGISIAVGRIAAVERSARTLKPGNPIGSPKAHDT